MREYDGPWKETIAFYFRDFLLFFFPSIAEDIEWEFGFEFLDTELQKIKRETETGIREADKLVKVWRKTGEEQWVFLHIEIQSQRKTDFCERMYIYHNRIFDRYRKTVVSLAILGDEEKGWRPSKYKHKLWGCGALLKFPVVKLLDYDMEELVQDPNPLAAIVQAHRIAQIANQDVAIGYQNKLSLIKSLYERGYSRENIVELFRLIDWFIALPEWEEERLWQEIQALEEDKNMPYVTSVERIGIKKGRQEGRQEGLQQAKQQDIVRILEVRFEDVTQELKLLIGKLDDLELLGNLLAQAVTTPSLDEFKSLVSQHVADDESE
ncbi:MAG: transposase [Symploca sp. SIO3E6]|nr:transposase [Caldora sp. SIO3E6]